LNLRPSTAAETTAYSNYLNSAGNNAFTYSPVWQSNIAPGLTVLQVSALPIPIQQGYGRLLLTTEAPPPAPGPLTANGVVPTEEEVSFLMNYLVFLHREQYGTVYHYTGGKIHAFRSTLRVGRLMLDG
jgi:hypothetical protein